MNEMNLLSSASGSPSASTNLGAGEVTFIGTATTLVRYARFTILTDPDYLHQGVPRQERSPASRGPVRSGAEQLTDP
jgi:L-ascorbate metabolism protein UlaG (beta-lactamase superfamily)